MSPWAWLTPALAALFLYGIGQGLVKKWISEVPPARFCLYFVVAKAVVNMGFFLTNSHPDPFAPESRAFLLAGVLAYVLDGAGWILYFRSIVAGPITIVGTLSAAYPALTVLFARVFLKETLLPAQYLGVALVIAGCLGLSYAPSDPDAPSGERDTACGLSSTEGTGACDACASGDGGSLPPAKIADKRWIPLAAAALVLWGGAQTIVKYSYGLQGASEVNLALFNTVGGVMTLGVFGFLKGRGGGHSGLEWLRAFLPMGMMAGGDLGVILATKSGPVSIVTPLTGAYPLVTLGFAAVALKEKVTRPQWVCIAMILVGMCLSPGAS